MSDKMFWCKVFTTHYGLVVALCDEDLLDKVIKTKKLEVKVSKHFYGGKLVNENIARKLLQKATIANLTGKNIVEIAARDGFIMKENVIFFDEVPHAQFVKIQ